MWGAALVAFATTASVANRAHADEITAEADGDRISWETTGVVGQTWGLLALYHHLDPAVSDGWHWAHAPAEVDETTIWATNGAGTYHVEVCEWNFSTMEITTCSNPMETTWVYDVNGTFVAIPAADPTLEAGTIALAADGAALAWEVTGDLGQASGFMVLDGEGEYWQPPQARQTQWWPAQGWLPGIHELRVCGYDHYRDQLGTCSNPVDVEVALNGWGQPAAVTQPDAADEQGTIDVALDGCALHWETTGTVGQTHGFMVMTQPDADPEYGTAVHRYAAPQLRDRDMTDVPTVGTQHLAVCAYDFHRNEVGQCSDSLVFDFAWAANGPTCTVSAADEPVPEPADAPAAEPYPVPPPEPVPPPGSAPGSTSEVIAAGLVAWRTADVEGNSCASCHTPDGIDLAYPAYTRQDILRRATEHVDVPSAEAIADMIEATRDAYGWVPTVDPRQFRPFQPGGHIVAGATALERDEGFATALVEQGLIIATGDIDDLATAQAARDELLEVDLWSLPVGVPFDRFSEDSFFGPEHGAINEWVPAVGHVPHEAEAQQWWALQDDYIANPSESLLYALLDAVADDAGPVHLNYEDLRGGIEAFEAERFRSMMVLGHEQRREMSGAPPRGADDLMPYETTTIWQVGARAYEAWTCNPVHGGDADDCMQFPAGSISDTQSQFEQMEVISLAWRYTGWLFDQQLQDVPAEATLARGHYLGLELKHGGYPSHHAFMRAMRAVRTYWGADQSWRADRFYATNVIPETSAFADLVFMDNFMAAGGAGQEELTFAPAAGAHRQQYLRFTANMYKMLLLLLEDEIARTGQVYEQAALVEMLRAQAGQRWYGPVDYVPVLVEWEPQRAAEFQVWIAGIADAAEAAQEVAFAPSGF